MGDKHESNIGKDGTINTSISSKGSVNMPTQEEIDELEALKNTK